RLTGEKAEGAAPALTLALDLIPVAAGLDALRTLRNGLDPELEAGGTVGGKLVYDPSTATVQPAKPAKSKHTAQSAATPSGPLSGSLTVADFALTGAGLSKPVQVAKMVFKPSAAPLSAEALTGTFDLPAGGDAPIVFTLKFSLAGYQVNVRGPAAIARARELAHIAEVSEAKPLAALAGDPLTTDLVFAGPWLPPEDNLASVAASDEPAPAPKQNVAGTVATPLAPVPAADSLTGTVTLRNVNWKADFLANHVQISEATLHLDGAFLRWDPVVFTYGPVKGTVALSRVLKCPPSAEPVLQTCGTQFQMRFGDLDASTLESALLGAQPKATLFSDFIDRLRPASSPPWPALQGTVSADSMVLGPVTLHGVAATVRVAATGADISSFDAALFGGNVHLTGSLAKPSNDRDKPAYTFEGDFQKINVAQLGALLRLRWTGAALTGNGKVGLAGYTAKDLASSARGALHFECRRGALGNQPPTSAKAEAIPAALGSFDQWTADATIGSNGVTLDQNSVTVGAHRHSVVATVKFGDPPVVSFAPAKPLPQKQ
ncbi:MAG: hypothetical protein ACRD3S_00350, partial [Terracidiphilus sp.]